MHMLHISCILHIIFILHIVFKYDKEINDTTCINLFNYGYCNVHACTLHIVNMRDHIVDCLY